ncbi:hypothetical protein BBF96_08285 [Anoxybacter fermentans]|uniref:HTH lacI-type domain-containing protein n=1 Tax=Anoxybacter fermentans TaxID=1323375 RepID=A0A3Q9HQN3_9FIRM|nr:LacI family DNA-binding transcriptional regulator [Anoxybacter fermentans]AZR73380.1 hypothetical protein BBF96_08285 [Anoxybacter fermentans]
MKATIKDVARLANVSISTVSRYINGADNLKPETRQKIKKAISQLNYRPNKIAQSLGSRLCSIGVIATRSSEMAFANPYFSEVLKGIGSIAEANQYDIVLCSSEDEEKEIERCLSLIDGGIVQGLILLSSRIYDRLIYELIRIKFPFVLIGRILPETLPEPDEYQIYTVNTPNFNDSYNMTKYLIEQGHEKIGFIQAPMNYVVSHDRYQGFCQALQDAGLPLRKEWVINGGYTWKDAYDATIALLSNPPLPTAIFASDDLKAVGACKAIKQAGLKVPDDISIVGHNDYEMASINEPELTTIRVPIYELGLKATKLLIDVINGKKVEPEIILPTQLIKRKSVRSLK